MNPNISSYLKFSKDIFWVFLSQIVVGLFGIITLPALTKNFGTEIYGLWSQIYVTAALLFPILTLYFGTAIVRYLSHENNQKKLSQEISAMLFTILILIIIVTLISFLLSKQLSFAFFKNSNFATFIPLMLMWSGANAIFNFLTSYMRSRSRIKLLSILNLACSIIQLSFIFILAYSTQSILLVVISQIIIQSIFVIIVYASIMNELGFSLPNFKNIPKYISFCLPQIPSGILMWILNFSDRYFILYYLSLAEVGIYSVSYNLGSIISFLYAPIGFVVYPILTKYWEESKFDEVNRYLEYSTKIFLALSIPASLGLYVLSAPLLKILTTSQFVIGGVLILLIALGTIFLGLFQLNIYIIYLVQQTKLIPLMTLLSSVVNIIFNILLIPKIGIIGAAFATIISYLILAVIVSYWARKEINYHIDIKFLFKVILASVLMSIIINFLIPYLKNTVTLTLLCIPIGAIIYFIILMLFKSFTEGEKKLIYKLYHDLKSNLFN